MSQFAREVTAGNRFEFGKNWAWFLETLDDTKIAEATHSLQDMLEVTSLEGQSFLDLGSGSGLFSHIARLRPPHSRETSRGASRMPRRKRLAVEKSECCTRAA